MSRSERPGPQSDQTREEFPFSSGRDPKLVFRTGPSRGKVLAIERERLSIGRESGNDIVIQDDLVSSRHVVLARDPSDSAAFWIQDSGSKNGTFLNGRRLEAPVLLKDGDVFCLARAGPEIQFTYGTPSLPSLLSTTSATFARTRSFESAARELLPLPGKKGKVSASGVREIVDRRLEERTRKSRWLVLQAFISGAALMLIGGLVLLMSGRDTSQAKLDLELDAIYGNVFRSYKESPVGRVVVVNEGEHPLTGVQLEFDLYSQEGGVKKELLREHFVRVLSEVLPGQSREVEITPVLSNQILSPTDQDVTAEVRLSRDGKVFLSKTRALMVYGYHVFSWKNPERIAALIYTEDPLVLAFVNSVWKVRPGLTGDEFPPRNVTSAVALLTAVAERGLRYLDDPQTPSSVAEDSSLHDRVKLPGETLVEGTGDCDDLSVLCCSLLKAAGISTALLVGGDHVLFMFDTGLEERDAEGSPFPPESVIQWQGRIWIPVEATRLAEAPASFATAWSEAWKRKQAVDAGEMLIIDIQKAWKNYRPLPPGLSGTLDTSQVDRWFDGDLRAKISSAVDELRSAYLQRILDSKVDRIDPGLEGLAREQQIGLLLARSGLYSEARKVFERAVFEGRMPRTREKILNSMGKAEVGLDTAAVLEDLAITMALGASGPGAARDLALAAGCYELALKGIPESFPERVEIMIRLALVYRESGELGEAEVWIDRAFRLDPTARQTYRELTRRGGPVAGRSRRISAYLEKGL